MRHIAWVRSGDPTLDGAMIRRVLFLVSVLSLLIWLMGVWVLSYRRVECIGYAAPSRGELDVLMKNGRVAIVWGPPAEQFLGTRSIAPGTPSEPHEIYLVPLRSGFVRGAGRWIVQLLREGG